MGEEELVDRYSGMISRSTARKAIAGGASGALTPLASLDKAKDGDTASVEDVVYRVFNAKRYVHNCAATTRRTVVLGGGQAVANLVLWDSKADLPDTLPIERGDQILVANVIVRHSNGNTELIATAGSTVSLKWHAARARSTFDSLPEGEREVDLRCKVISLDKERQSISPSGRPGKVVNCTVSDGTNEAALSLWDSSCEAAGSIHAGDEIKVERCAVKGTIKGLELIAGDSSRILVLAKRQRS